jgi:hypothetical protein
MPLNCDGGNPTNATHRDLDRLGPPWVPRSDKVGAIRQASVVDHFLNPITQSKPELLHLGIFTLAIRIIGGARSEGAITQFQ